MVEYKCDSCDKSFIDKTKYTTHINKKKKCIPKNKISTSSSTLSMISYFGATPKQSIMGYPEKELKLTIYKGKTTEENQIMPIIGKNSKLENLPVTNSPLCISSPGLCMSSESSDQDNRLCRLCRLCRKTYKDTFINHLVDEHGIQKNEFTFTFSNKNSGTTIYADNDDGGDIVLYIFENNHTILFTTKNLHNLQRHKKEKYRDVLGLYYYPCKNIKLFKNDFIIKCKELGLKDDDKIQFMKCESIIYELLIKINENSIKENQTRKTVAPYKISTYFTCPFCEEKNNDINDMNEHITESHKYVNNNFMDIDEEQEEKIFNMIEKNELCRDTMNQVIHIEEMRCDYCNHLFSSKFNLRRHMKMNCKQYLNMTQNEITKDDLFNIIENNEKLRNENKILKNALVNTQELIKDQNENLRNSVNYFSKTTNIIQNNNILFNINDFGQEDISHIDMEFIEEIIKQMSTQSLVRFIEEVHYGNPKNCNVIIPTNIPSIQDKNLLLLKKGDRWVLDKRKNVIDDMLAKNMDRLTDVYEDIQPNLSNNVKSGFESYVSDMGNENQKCIRNEAFDQTEQLFINKQPNSFLLETLKVQQNNFIEGNWKESIDYQIPNKISNIEDNQIINQFFNEN